MSNVTGHYQSIHFKMDDLELFYNMPVLAADDTQIIECHYVKNLLCSKAHELTAEQCVEDRKCEIQANMDQLFTDLGIHAPTLMEIDKKLRGKK